MNIFSQSKEIKPSPTYQKHIFINTISNHLRAAEYPPRTTLSKHYRKELK